MKNRRRLQRLFLRHTMAGWQQHVDALLGTGKLHQVAILGHDGRTWATSPSFAVRPFSSC